LRVDEESHAHPLLFCIPYSAGLCDGAVMVTASHLPSDRNGFKLFTSQQGGFTKQSIQQMNQLAADFAQEWHDIQGMLPPTSGGEGVFCSEWVDFMPHYATTLKNAIGKEVQQHDKNDDKPLQGLTIVLNAGHGSGGFFNAVLKELGADVSASMGVEPNAEFPAGIPNPEKKKMMEDTSVVCEQVGADLGILLDTDADRSGFIVPVRDVSNGSVTYQPLNRNRLIALLAVIFSRTAPGCAIVTDSVTSEGLADFLERDLGLQHVRYLKGYANVIGKAQELTHSGIANAEMAIETSGHCAMKENGYLDDGTYTAVKVIGLLARQKLAHDAPDLLSLISAMKEMPEEAEIRMNVADGSLETMAGVFELASRAIERSCQSSLPWTLDTENLEGIRVRTGSGGFFMLRKSLHDPLISLQIESQSHEQARDMVVGPLLELFRADKNISTNLETNNLEKY
jgi:phosphomannomutase